MAYTITFDPDGGTCQTSTVSVDGGEAIGTKLPPATRDGYLFIGWYKTGEYGLDLVFPAMTFSADTKVTARWLEAAPEGGELQYYYPDGDVIDVSQITTGLKYQYNSDGTAYVLSFTNFGDPGTNNADAVGDVVVPYIVMHEQSSYVVVSVGIDDSTNTGGDGTNENLTGCTLPITIRSILRSALSGCANLSKFSGVGIEAVLRNCFSRATSLREIFLPNATSLAMGFAIQSGATSIILPKCMFFGASALCRLFKLKHIEMPLLERADGYNLCGITEISTISLPTLSRVGGLFLGNMPGFSEEVCARLVHLNLPNLVTAESSFCKGAASLESISLPELIGFQSDSQPAIAKDSALSGCTALRLVSLPKVTTIGSYTFQDCTEDQIDLYLSQPSVSVGGFSVAPRRICLRKDKTLNGISYDAASQPQSITLGGKTIQIEWYDNESAPQFTITFDNQSGSGSVTNLTASYGYDVPEIDSVPVRTGYEFGGFYTDPDGLGLKYYNADGTSNREWDWLEDKRLYAKWTAEEYVVTFNANAESVTADPATESVTYGEPYGELATTSDRTGYDFAGWWTDPAGGTLVTSSTEVSTAGNHTLYAHWIAKKVTVSFDFSGGSGGTESVTATYGESMPHIVVPTKTGFGFAGYYSEQSGGGTQYYDETGKGLVECDEEDDIALYADWTAVTYSATVLPGHEGSGDEPESYQYSYSESDQTVEVSLPERDGYIISRWSFSAINGTLESLPSIYHDDGSDKDYILIRGGTATDFSATPIWASTVQYTVTFEANPPKDHESGEYLPVDGSMSPQTITYGSYKPLNWNQYEIEGYEFIGWNTTAEGDGNAYSDGADGSRLVDLENLPSPPSVMLYAMWKEESQGQDEVSKSSSSIGEPSFDVPISPIPNQIVSRTFRGITYELHFRTFNGMMYADVAVNGEPVVNGVRCISNSWLIPNYATSVSGSGNFMFRTLGDAYPWYADFGDTCKLGFYDEDDYKTAREEA